MVISLNIHRHFESFSPEHSSENRCNGAILTVDGGWMGR